MRNIADPTSVPSDYPEPFTAQLRLAVAAYLARFTGTSRTHTASDLRCYLSWCAGRGLDPLAARRPHLELYIRWMQEARQFKPSTVSRRFSVVAGFYRTCVIDGLLDHSPAEHVRRPAVPAESPTLGSRTCSSRPCSPRAGLGEPQPHGLGIPVAGQVIDPEADQGAFDDGQRAVVIEPGGAVG
jgi:hypothetical protein